MRSTKRIERSGSTFHLMRVAPSAREVGACTTAHENASLIPASYPHMRKSMRNFAIMLGGVCALLSSLIAVGSGLSAHAADLPSYFKEIVGTETASPAEIGTKNILQLNTTMFELYGDAG